MSHFFGIVLVPNLNDVETKISMLLEPYSENLQVKEHDKNCYCINQECLTEINKELKTIFPGGIESFRKSFREKYPEFTNYFALNDEEAEKSNKLWGEHLTPYTDVERALQEHHPSYNRPNKSCKTCKGTGRYKSRYNEQSKWDWWVIGGRWDEVIHGNSIPVKNLLESKDNKRIPFVIVTPDGVWHEKGEMGWFSVAYNEKSRDDWAKEARSILADYPDYIAVGCDFHI